ncbi:hypothetical protein BG616_02520 [Bacillus subtilis]|nr:hypothetical protein BG616_02520 [Bacillus subtilis]
MNKWYLALKNNWVSKAEQMRDEVKEEIELVEENQLVKGLYLSNDLDLVRETFQFFEETSMYPDMEWYGVYVGDYLSTKNELKGANEFYRKAIDARIKIQRGSRYMKSKILLSAVLPLGIAGVVGTSYLHQENETYKVAERIET